METTSASIKVTAMDDPSPPLSPLDADPSDVVGQHVGRVDGPSLSDEGHGLEHLNRVDDRDDGGKEQRVSEQRQGDVGEALNRIGAVDGRRLKHGGRDLR